MSNKFRLIYNLIFIYKSSKIKIFLKQTLKWIGISCSENHFALSPICDELVIPVWIRTYVSLRGQSEHSAKYSTDWVLYLNYFINFFKLLNCTCIIR